ncbi:hypothetical protein [Bacillus sp. B-jedd]|uniref:hypothetical protein n=1 Tax=Bacillus sp. B-jedd TaxID=1476857 RepID=UPI000515712C|nr:hypothetical protein [Bacillus sp. B-jedd]CEG25546.1 hypothetical protein BN1002_00358 [Bacillus sp. B-jedd]
MMKSQRVVAGMTISIMILAAVAASWGIFSGEGPGSHPYTSLDGKMVELYGKGLYQNDSVSGAEQEIAQDIVTLLIGIPVLLASLYMYQKGLLKGKLLLAGTLGYFLYTYTSYSFLSSYNSFFLVYITLMSLSFFSFTLVLLSFNLNGLATRFNPRMPVRFLGGMLIFLGIAVGLLWVGRIIPGLLSHTAPPGLDHYTTLVIQALDLGFVLPAGVFAGILLIKRRPAGYLLGPVMIIKAITLLAAIMAMAIRMIAAGVQSSLAEIAIFGIFTLLFLYCLYLVLVNVIETEGHHV